MANFVYTKAKESLLKGEINTASSNYRVALIDSSKYTPNISSDQYFSQIPSNAVVGISGNVENITNINRSFRRRQCFNFSRWNSF